jgi:nitrite reductase/ring-hydroxylating ferredoxin subunit
MHELRYLKLYYSKLNNEALFAILDSCPHMEYLHASSTILRQHFIEWCHASQVWWHLRWWG